MRKNYYIIFLGLFILYGCATKQQYLLLGQDSNQSTKSFKYSIGVKNIELPQYLLHKNIPMLIDNKEIIYLKNKEWAIYLDEQLTNRIVSTLQKSLNSPNIYRYPQNSISKPEIIIQIIVHKFIADENSVMLDASWEQNRFDKIKSGRFSIKIPVSSKDDIVEVMNKAFSALELKLIREFESIK